MLILLSDIRDIDCIGNFENLNTRSLFYK